MLALTLLTAGLVAGPLMADTACVVQNPKNMPAEGRQSALDSMTFAVGASRVKVCYGRPALRGRSMIGGAAVPYGKLWRTGANEPTVFWTPVRLDIAGIAVPAGFYSLYTVPGEREWEIVVNRATAQWGHESRYTEAVRKQEVGRGKAPAERLQSPVETFTIRAEQTGGAQQLLLEWDHARVRIPVKAAG